MATSAIENRELWLPPLATPWTDRAFSTTQGWSAGSFAREQIRGLVRQLFFSNAAQPVRQVVFSAADSQTDVGIICQQVGEALASETQGGIAVVGCGADILEVSEKEQTFGARRPGEGVGSRPAAPGKSNLGLCPVRAWREREGPPSGLLIRTQIMPCCLKLRVWPCPPPTWRAQISHDARGWQTGSASESHPHPDPLPPKNGRGSDRECLCVSVLLSSILGGEDRGGGAQPSGILGAIVR